MQREIKFRVWDKVDYMSTPFIFKDLQDGKIQFTSDCPVMQYTGLKDKNGKDIYEGDIVKWDDGSKGKYWRVAEVFYDTDSAMFSFRIIKNVLHELSCEEGYVFGGNFALRGKHQNPSKQLIVIGNIYENQDLLFMDKQSKS